MVKAKLIRLLSDFASGSDRSMDAAGRIEVLLDELFGEQEPYAALTLALASYRPKGGEFLYDGKQIAAMIEPIVTQLIRSDPDPRVERPIIDRDWRRDVTDLDLLAATGALAELLDTHQLSVWSERLRSAVSGASTGGELVMAVRHHLRSLRGSSDPIPQDVRTRIDDLIAAIDETGW